MVMSSRIEEIVRKFPGPTTLPASRLKCWVRIIFYGGWTATFIFAAISSCLHPSRVRGDVHVVLEIVILCAIISGLCTVAAVIALCSSSLRLDEDGFEVIGLFRRQYRWSDVSDFGIPCYFRGQTYVLFKTTEPCRNIHELIVAFFAGGRNRWLPDTYGFAPGDLLQLIKTWQSAATNAPSRS